MNYVELAEQELIEAYQAGLGSTAQQVALARAQVFATLAVATAQE